MSTALGCQSERRQRSDDLHRLQADCDDLPHQPHDSTDKRSGITNDPNRADDPQYKTILHKSHAGCA